MELMEAMLPSAWFCGSIACVALMQYQRVTNRQTDILTTTVTAL